jgi:hypothetical protein
MHLPIKFAHIKTRKVVKYPEGGYKFFEPKKYAWLARFAWKLLTKLKALDPFHYTYDVQTFGYTEQENITRAILEQFDHIVRDNRRINDFVFLVGSDTFHELTHLNVLEPIQFPLGEVRYGEMKSEDGCRVYEHRYSIRGLVVHVSPYVSGMAIVPRDLFESKQKITIEEKVTERPDLYGKY